MAGGRLIKQGERRRKKMVTFIERYWKKNGFAPTIQEIAEGVGLSSPNATRQHLMKLQAAGVIQMRPRVARSIRVLEVPVAKAS